MRQVDGEIAVAVGGLDPRLLVVDSVDGLLVAGHHHVLHQAVHTCIAVLSFDVLRNKKATVKRNLKTFPKRRRE